MNEPNRLPTPSLPTPVPLDVKLRRRWWWVLLCGVVGAVGAFAFIQASKKYVGTPVPHPVFLSTAGGVLGLVLGLALALLCPVSRKFPVPACITNQTPHAL